MILNEKVINYLESLGFVTVSHKSSPRKIYFKDDITVTVEKRSRGYRDKLKELKKSEKGE